MASIPLSYLINEKNERVYFDAVTTRTLNYMSTVPEYPTEAGYKVSDAVIAGLPSVEIDGVLSMMSTRANSDVSIMAQAALGKLREFYFGANLLTYVYGGGAVNPYQKRIKNLVIESLSFPEEASYGKAIQVRMSLKQMQFPKEAIGAFTVGEATYDLGGSSNAKYDSAVTSSDAAMQQVGRYSIPEGIEDDYFLYPMTSGSGLAGVRAFYY